MAKIPSPNKMKLKLFTRQELWLLRARCYHFAKLKHLNPIWKRIYEDLADAIDHLDAAMGRSTIPFIAYPLKNKSPYSP